MSSNGTIKATIGTTVRAKVTYLRNLTREGLCTNPKAECPLEYGTVGTIVEVAEWGSVLVRWDNGLSLYAHPTDLTPARR